MTTLADLKAGRVSLEALAISRGTLHTLTGPDPQSAPDFDLDPPVTRPEENK